jgi:hypothetical protein
VAGTPAVQEIQLTVRQRHPEGIVQGQPKHGFLGAVGNVAARQAGQQSRDGLEGSGELQHGQARLPGYEQYIFREQRGVDADQYVRALPA